MDTEINLKIVNTLRSAGDFLSNANKLFNQNIVFNTLLIECLSKLACNTVYKTMCDKDYDFNCREHEANLVFMWGCCVESIGLLRDFRNMTNDKCVFFITRKVADMLLDAKGLIEHELPTERFCQSDKKNKEQTE